MCSAANQSYLESFILKIFSKIFGIWDFSTAGHTHKELHWGIQLDAPHLIQRNLKIAIEKHIYNKYI